MVIVERFLLSGFFLLFFLFFFPSYCFFYHWITRFFMPLFSFLPPRRLSARFGRMGWSAYRDQNAWEALGNPSGALISLLVEAFAPGRGLSSIISRANHNCQVKMVIKSLHRCPFSVVPNLAFVQCNLCLRNRFQCSRCKAS